MEKSKNLHEALLRLSTALNNVCLEWDDDRSMEAVLVDYAVERISALEAENKRLKDKLETYVDCFEQLGVKSLAELVERYDNKVDKLEAENERLKEQIEAMKMIQSGSYFALEQERDALKEKVERLEKKHESK